MSIVQNGDCAASSQVLAPDQSDQAVQPAGHEGDCLTVARGQPRRRKTNLFRWHVVFAFDPFDQLADRLGKMHRPPWIEGLVELAERLALARDGDGFYAGTAEVDTEDIAHGGAGWTSWNDQ